MLITLPFTPSLSLSVFLDCRDTHTLPLSNVKGKLMELVRKWWSDSGCCLCTWVCVLQRRIDMRSAPLFIFALRVSTEIGDDWGQKHSPAISPPTTCFLPVYCAIRSLWTFPLTSLTSLSHFYRFMVLPPESSTPWSVWKAHCRERCWRLFRLKIRMFAILLSLSTLCTPQSSHFLSFGFFDLVFYNPFFWFFSFTYQHCWSRSPGRNLWPPGLLPSAAYGLLWRILKADRETTV